MLVHGGETVHRRAHTSQPIVIRSIACKRHRRTARWVSIAISRTGRYAHWRETANSVAWAYAREDPWNGKPKSRSDFTSWDCFSIYTRRLKAVSLHREWKEFVVSRVDLHEFFERSQLKFDLHRVSVYPLSRYRKFLRLSFDESIRPINRTNHGIDVPRITLSLRTFVCKLLLISLPLPTHSHSVDRVISAFSRIIVPRPIKIHRDNREIKNTRDNTSEMRERWRSAASRSPPQRRSIGWKLVGFSGSLTDHRDVGLPANLPLTYSPNGVIRPYNLARCLSRSNRNRVKQVVVSVLQRCLGGGGVRATAGEREIDRGQGRTLPLSYTLVRLPLLYGIFPSSMCATSQRSTGVRPAF